MFWDVLNSQLYKCALNSQQQVIVYQLFAKGRWFSPGTPASSTTKTGRHDIVESGIKHQKINQSIKMYVLCNMRMQSLLYV